MTTVKLIASAAACTNAALCYYFEHGKDQILQEALLEILSRKMRTFEQLEAGLPFPDFVRQIGELASNDFEEMTDNISWLVVEFPHLPQDLQRELHEHLLKGHENPGACVFALRP